MSRNRGINTFESYAELGECSTFQTKQYERSLFESYAELGECSTRFLVENVLLVFESYAELGECSTLTKSHAIGGSLRVMLN